MTTTQENQTTENKQEIPEEFHKIIKDFVSDIITTFPEYEAIINRWWKPEDPEKLKVIFNHCLSVFPERFFDILYQNQDIFKEESVVNTEFLPGISFKYLWTCDISEKTKETLWKYLQLILLSIIGCVKDRTALGDTAKLFESINEEDFKGKLQETLEKMQNVFGGEGENAQTEGGEGINMDNIPNADDIHSHISGMLDSKLGNLAREIAEETAQNLDLDFENMTDMKDVFQNLFKNPGKLMGLVKNVGEKLDTRLKSGDIKESELMAEASNIMSKMKNMPGMENIQEMLSKMGMAGMMPPGMGRNVNLDTNAMENRLKQNTKMMQMNERLKQKAQEKQMQKQMEEQQMHQQLLNQKPALTDDELSALFGQDEKAQKTPRGAKPPPTSGSSGKKKKSKK
jgi:hypothetical protein